MMKKIYISVAVLLILGLGALLYFKEGKSGIVWMDVNKVYSDFDYKKEMDAKYLKTETARKKIIDSLELDLKLIFNQMQNNPKDDEKVILFETKRAYFLEKKQQLDSDSENTRAKYYEQIVSQINQYVRDYGKEKGYSVILGADGTGAIMYAEEKIDITKEITTYVNNKYKGL
ncbi:MAG: OmpH family outer membrane protein [Bacteroidota bacterium]|nr:OmpH family outer membrane protein [Bacteroidota bacterium]